MKKEIKVTFDLDKPAELWAYRLLRESDGTYAELISEVIAYAAEKRKEEIQ